MCIHNVSDILSSLDENRRIIEKLLKQIDSGRNKSLGMDYPLICCSEEALKYIELMYRSYSSYYEKMRSYINAMRCTSESSGGKSFMCRSSMLHEARELLKDIDDKAAIESEREKAKSISKNISDVSDDQVQAAERRKKLREALLSGTSEVTVSQDGVTVDSKERESDDKSFQPAAKPVYGGGDPFHNSIHVPSGKLAGGYGMCRFCGTVFNQPTKFCPECGTKSEIEKPSITLDKVYFSAIAPKALIHGEYSMIEIFMYEEDFRHVVDEAIGDAEDVVKETKSGATKVNKKAKITVELSSPDIELTDNQEEQVWYGEYLNFSFPIELPDDYQKRQVLFVSTVYINNVIATRLKFIAKCSAEQEQKMEISREDILSAFVSYASQDRNRVAMIIQGMRKVRPDMDIFFDVDSLRSGDDWEQALWREIDKRDVLFLCWSKHARNSKWVDAEWRYAFNRKGEAGIEPIPIDPPGICPPPDELSRKHFNDKILYIINAEKGMQEYEHRADELVSRLESLF